MAAESETATATTTIYKFFRITKHQFYNFGLICHVALLNKNN